MKLPAHALPPPEACPCCLGIGRYYLLIDRQTIRSVPCPECSPVLDDVIEKMLHIMGWKHVPDIEN